jgi:hypothetical protein
MKDDDEVIERLDKLILLFQLAFADSIDATRRSIRMDPVKAAILDSTSTGWTPSATTRAAIKKLGTSESTFKNKVSELLAAGLLERRGATTSVEYRSRGVI